MTDEQIVKALEYCVVRNRECLSCPYSEKTYCVDTDALNLIKRQKAEIERLQKILDKRCDVCPAATTAIKEFWVKLKGRALLLCQTKGNTADSHLEKPCVPTQESLMSFVVQGWVC